MGSVQGIDSRLPEGTAKYISELGLLKKDDIIILHEGCATDLNVWVQSQKCRKIMVYHNITPAHFFSQYDSVSEKNCAVGIEQVKKLKNTFNMILTASAFNKQDLINMGYNCSIYVRPPLIPFDDYKTPPSNEILGKYDDDYTNIIFVGRISPHKCQHDVVRAFVDYQKHYNKKSRLFIVGSYSFDSSYHERLREYVEKITQCAAADNIIITGHTKFNEILAYYKCADLFLCQSEHEGFCVPLVEAMIFDVPVVAYDSSAIGETLGGSGFLMKEKKPLETAAVMNKILTDDNLRKSIIENQRERLADFQYDKVKASFLGYLDKFIQS